MGVAQECKDCERGECPEYCAEMVQVELDEIIDSVRKEATDTLEQHYHQLAEVARDMYEWCDGVINKCWTIVPERVDGFRKQLEELGVEV